LPGSFRKVEREGVVRRNDFFEIKQIKKMRKLASIQKIKALEAIEGADAIERATVLGWHLVVKKGEFEVGDMVVYCEVDSVMPDKPEFEFLKPRGMRIKTIRLRGQISQGICFPLSILPPDYPIYEGADCTEILGVKKYEEKIPACLSGVAKGIFPYFIPKTDETRVQNLQKDLDKNKGQRCYVAEKLDGSSVTFYMKDGVFGVCSRNLDLMEDAENSFWKIAREMMIEEKLRPLGKNVAIQGELIGEGIQGNKLKIKGQTVRFFNVYDIDKSSYLGFSDFKRLVEGIGLETVPIIDADYVLEDDIDSIIRMATAKSQMNKDVWAEGIVIRSLEGDSEDKKRLSFKAINPEFLLRHGG
jgi:RNA ligase (TIGR02306 family)